MSPTRGEKKGDPHDVHSSLQQQQQQQQQQQDEEEEDVEIVEIPERTIRTPEHNTAWKMYDHDQPPMTTATTSTDSGVGSVNPFQQFAVVGSSADTTTTTTAAAGSMPLFGITSDKYNSTPQEQQLETTTTMPYNQGNKPKSQLPQNERIIAAKKTSDSLPESKRLCSLFDL